MINKLKLRFTLALLFGVLMINSYGQINPQVKYGLLFQEIQRNHIFNDQKRFLDCEPKNNPDSIIHAYNSQKTVANFKLKDFIAQHFDTLQNDTLSMLKHVDYLWLDLTREKNKQNRNSSLIALPNSYIVPGGRFKEIYYWDSYFTMLGLCESAKVAMIENMVDNFAFLIKTYGHIPNGNRTYYLSRSQPPFFSLMVNLLAEIKNDSTIYTKYLSSLEQEYKYWMTGDKLVQIDKNDKLNRYCDDLNTPRPESFGQDENVFAQAKRDSSIFKDIRSAAESGWDFSSRWFNDELSISTINTTQIIPVDLNCLLVNLELTLAKGYEVNKNEKKCVFYRVQAQTREKLICKYFWDEEKGFFFDYNFKTKKRNKQYTLAALFPMFFNIATEHQAEKVKFVIEKDFLKNGGLVTTLASGSLQQWDYPNGWAPLQWIGYKALKNYNYTTLANETAKRWIDLNIKVYFATGKMMEKYNVVDTNKPGGGGEYDAQDGFGWTNGVFLKLWSELNQKPTKNINE